MTLATAVWIHALFEWAAILVGSQLYLRSQRSSVAKLPGPRFAILVGCALGAGLGSKLSYLSYEPQGLQILLSHPLAIGSGQSIVGGLLGGWIGVEIAKQTVGVRQSTGDAFVGPILVGLIIGRIGCLLAGQYDETSGLPTDQIWGLDYGDGVKRHPTQIYDMLFAAAALSALPFARSRFAARSGLVFKLFMASYLSFRFAVDFLKPAPTYFLGSLSGIQIWALVGAIVFLSWAAVQWRRMETSNA